MSVKKGMRSAAEDAILMNLYSGAKSWLGIINYCRRLLQTVDYHPYICPEFFSPSDY